jgi:hypothetical protein
MKSLRQIVELKKIDLVPDPELQAGTVSNYANPKSDAERRFVEKHVDSIQKTLHPAFKNEAEQKAVFSGTVEKDKTHDNAGAGHYQDGEDAAVYEAAEAAVDFVRENLTEDNLQAYDELLDNDPDAAVEFAMETVQEMAGEEDA